MDVPPPYPPTDRPAGTGAPQPVRIAMSLTGGASLGAFQAGAVAALLVAVARLQQRDTAAGRDPSVRVDAIGVTSAGALVGLLAARCLLAGLDPVHVLHACWVQGATWRRLRPRGARSPLSLREVEHSLRNLLDPRDRHDRPEHRLDPGARQPVPVLLHVVTGSLQGAAYPVHRRRGGPLPAMTHVADARFVLRPSEGVEAYLEPERASPIDVVIAALSHPAVFPPRLLDRPGSEAGQEWCTDGAALLQAPLGRSLAAGRQAEELDGAGPGRRVHLLIHPHTAGPEPDDRWTAAEQPAWARSLGRLVACLDPEPIYDDLRRIEETNDRLRRARALLDAVGPHLPDAAGPALAACLDGAAPPGAAARDLLATALAEVSDLAGKREVETEVVSPLAVLAGDVGAQGRVPDVLAGNGAGRFAGFLDPALRHEDFTTGWRSTRAWLPGALDRHGLDADAVREATAAVDERVLPPAPRRLPWPGTRARFRIVRTAARAARVAAVDAVRGR